MLHVKHKKENEAKKQNISREIKQWKKEMLHVKHKKENEAKKPKYFPGNKTVEKRNVTRET